MKAPAVLEKPDSKTDETVTESLVPFIKVLAHAIAGEFLRLKEENLLHEAMVPEPVVEPASKKVRQARKRRSASNRQEAPIIDDSAVSTSTRRRKS